MLIIVTITVFITCPTLPSLRISLDMVTFLSVEGSKDHILGALTLLVTVYSVFATAKIVNSILYFPKENTEANQDLFFTDHEYPAFISC